MSSDDGRWDDGPENVLRFPGPDAVLAGPTFDEWLDSRVIA